MKLVDLYRLGRRAGRPRPGLKAADLERLVRLAHQRAGSRLRSAPAEAARERRAAKRLERSGDGP